MSRVFHCVHCARVMPHTHMSSAPWLTNELLTDLQSCAGRHSADRIRSILERGDPSTLAAWFHVPELKVLIRVLTVKFAAVLPRRIMGDKKDAIVRTLSEYLNDLNVRFGSASTAAAHPNSANAPALAAQHNNIQPSASIPGAPSSVLAPPRFTLTPGVNVFAHPQHPSTSLSSNPVNPPPHSGHPPNPPPNSDVATLAALYPWARYQAPPFATSAAAPPTHHHRTLPVYNTNNANHHVAPSTNHSQGPTTIGQVFPNLVRPLPSAPTIPPISNSFRPSNSGSLVRYLGIPYESPELMNILIKHASFTKPRSPLYSLQSTLAQSMFSLGNASDPKRKATCALSVAVETLQLMKAGSHCLQLRIFGSLDDCNLPPKLQHIDNSGQFTVYVRNLYTDVQSKPIKRSGYRKAGYEITPPSDITKPFLEQSLQTTIINDRFGVRVVRITVDVIARAPFFGCAVVELAKVVSAADIVAGVVAAAAPIQEPGVVKPEHLAQPDSAPASENSSKSESTTVAITSSNSATSISVPLAVKPVCQRACAVCAATGSGLLRCSRCKNAWYCGPEHQALDWVLHRNYCTPPDSSAPAEAQPAASRSAPNTPTTKKIETKVETKVDHDDDVEVLDVEEGEVFISLKCPLSIMRIRVPGKGSKCKHAQCFDLQAFLDFASQSHNWQCPICWQPIEPSELATDPQLAQLLTTCDEEIERVSVLRGVYTPIADVEPAARQYAKRKLPADDDNASKRAKVDVLVSPQAASKDSESEVLSPAIVTAPVHPGSADNPIELD